MTANELVKKIFLTFIAVAFLIGGAKRAVLALPIGNITHETQISSQGNIPSYSEYSIDFGSGYALPKSKFEPISPLSEYAGVKGTLLEEGTYTDFRVTPQKQGAYRIKIVYVAAQGNNSEVEIALEINGKTPFRGSERMSLPKIYKDSKEITQDGKGNDIRPASKEILQEQTAYMQDYMGYQVEPYRYWLSAETQNIRIYSYRGDCLIKELFIEPSEESLSYEDYLKAHETATETNGQTIKIQAETPKDKSSSMLYAYSDRTSAYIEPHPGKYIRLNAFGGANFSKPGQWVRYDFTVEEEGFYYLDIKYKQNISSGMSSGRSILIDDQTLFEDMENIKFPYGSGWQSLTVGDSKPKKIFLDKGSHTISLKVSLGEYGDLVDRLEESVRLLNEAYLESVMYLTTSPDLYRDYDVKNNLPNVLELFRKQSQVLKAVSEDTYSLTGEKSDVTVMLDRFCYQLQELIKKPEEYPERLNEYKSNVNSLSALISSLAVQPLALDYLMFYSENISPQKAEAGFFQNAYNELRNFLYTFLSDYNSIGYVSENESAVNVWITSGRDQASVLKKMVDDDFFVKTGLRASLKLVAADMILPSIVAGIGPDVVMGIPSADPVNYAIRGAVQDLNAFDELQQVTRRFHSSAVEPLRFKDKLYALPETQNFYMLFYRKDVLEEMGLEVPKTWEETLISISELQKSNLLFGLPQDVQTYGMMLYQQGGQFHEKNTYLSNLHSETAVQTFTKLTGLFSNYKLPLSYDPLTRFRGGEMPLLVADFGFYNNLHVGAPEIRGLWDFTVVPGTDTSGEVRHQSISNGTACIILAQSKQKKAAWEFMKWWTDEVPQIRFSLEMEALLGTSARVPTANLSAFNQLPWTTQNKTQIAAQRQWVVGVENVPGGYFLNRHITNAFRKVVVSGHEARETLREYDKIIDAEITRKSNELKISVERNK